MPTELLSTDQLSFQIGDVVHLTDPDGPDRLAVVAATAHQPELADRCRCGCAAGTPSDQVTLLCVEPHSTGDAEDAGVAGNADGFHTVQASTTRLVPAGPSTPQQDQQARLLLDALVKRCISDREAAERRYEQAQGRATAAQETITSMRTYAIDRHRDGEICRQGLNDFLRAHDLDPYAPTYDATVDVTLHLTVDCEPDEDKDDIDWIIKHHLTVDSDDPCRLQIHDFSLEYDAIRDVQETT